MGALLTTTLIASGIQGPAQVIGVAQSSGEDRNRDSYGSMQALRERAGLDGSTTGGLGFHDGLNLTSQCGDETEGK